MIKAQIAFKQALFDFVVAISKEKNIDHDAVADILEQAGKHLLIHSSAARKGVPVDSLTDVCIVMMHHDMAEAVKQLLDSNKN